MAKRLDVWRWGRWCFALAVAGVLVSVAAAQAQIGTDRPGADYNRIEMPHGDPATCAARCDREQRCRAWAFNFPMTEEASAVCWLKSRVPRRVDAPFSVSGVRGAALIEPRTRAVEYSTDRFGGDYRSFPTRREPDGRSCQEACRNDPRCRAWTYLRPGYGGRGAYCYLKSRVTAPQRKACCVSGVVR